MNLYQIDNFNKKDATRVGAIQIVAPITIYTDLPPLPDFTTETPSTPPDFKSQEEIMKGLVKWYQAQFPNFGFGGAATAPVDTGAKSGDAKKAPEKQEVKEVFYTLMY